MSSVVVENYMIPKNGEVKRQSYAKSCKNMKILTAFQFSRNVVTSQQVILIVAPTEIYLLKRLIWLRLTLKINLNWLRMNPIFGKNFNYYFFFNIYLSLSLSFFFCILLFLFLLFIFLLYKIKNKEINLHVHVIRIFSLRNICCQF
eukprot:Pompholyxophrys_sp_v1_NODE_28_length_3713_cov_6.285128.p3 type:complete len:146 gc:universal NODE_28_length_3713_cov_6.285128:2285-1848(-)